MSRRMRRGVVWIAALAAVATMAHGAAGCSQCMCGTPFPSDVLGGVVPTQLTWGLEERYLSKSNGLDEAPGTEEEREHRVAALVLWRPIDQLALLGRLPFNAKEITTRPAGEAATRETSRGIGDAELFAMIGLFHTAGVRPVAIGAIAGGAAPTGSSNLHGADGERLDAHLQPGSGAWSGTAGIHATLTRGAGVFDASVLGRVNGTNAHGYRYGDALLYNTGFTSGAWRSVRALAQVNGRIAGRDRLEDGTMGVNTGGAVTYLSPGLRWSGGAGLSAEGALQIPVAQSLDGDQTEHATVRLSLSIAR